jgi:hypothetical protein
VQFVCFPPPPPPPQEAKIRSWAARPGAKIVILENPGFQYTQADGVVLKINVQCIIDSTKGQVFDMIAGRLIDIEDALSDDD